MVAIKPFKGYRYDDARDLSKLISVNVDIISLNI